MIALEVHAQKRYQIGDLPQEMAQLVKKKKCVNCKQHFDIRQGFSLEFALTSRTVIWWHQPKRISRGKYYSSQQCPKND